ncbi:hypothetical protein J7F02_06690 [Streptomyces sp. ISL-112]|uniref:hypothetical protein n=1 Tax=Streptomyces sp. ISL-112 TaxID=2819176 RepID=UPI001BE836B8|nr:hypothetical protein [Streptomyces sp. ISL-112]MBT2425379.1 hypothetical protein [Streptomyces sp. ISL-112]
MDDSKRQAVDRYEPDTALTRLIRIPVRIVVLLLVLPVRMVWDLLAAGCHAFDRTVLPPVRRALGASADALGRGLEWMFGGIGWAAGWLIGTLVLIPLRWSYTSVLTPLGRGLRWLGVAVLVPATLGLRTGLARLFAALLVVPAMGLWRHVLVPAARYGVVVPLVWLYGTVLTPVGLGTAWVLGKMWQAMAWWLGLVWQGLAATGRGLGIAVAWLVMTLLVAPASWLHRRVLAPAGREIAEAAEVAWRIAGYLSRAVGRGITWLFGHLIGVPVAWAYRTVCTPVGHFVRDVLWTPIRRATAEAGRVARGALATARETVRQARRDAWRALVGGTGGTRSGEPLGVPARTLGSTTTVPSAAQASETSLLGEKLVKQG